MLNGQIRYDDVEYLNIINVDGAPFGNCNACKGHRSASPYGGNNLGHKGFTDKKNLDNHWRDHKDNYEGTEIKTKEQYEARAVELAEMPCGKGILGYRSKDGRICRYDTKTNDYVKANINDGAVTMYKPKEGLRYFNRRRSIEEDDSE